MSQTVSGYSTEDSSPPPDVVGHAKLIGLLTLVSRILGLGREAVSAEYFGAGIVSSAFTVAFAVPNLFRKLFGEGALSAAFIPLYAQTVRAEEKGQATESASDFAAASVNLLCVLLLAVTIAGELVIGAIILLCPHMRGDWLLTLKFSAVMLPYVLLICGTAFLSSVLQVHGRFGAPAAAPIILNICHIVIIAGGAWFLGLHARTGAAAALPLQTRLAYWLSFFVLVAGVLQVMILLPSLRAVGFRFRWVRHFWTPTVRKMLKLSVPVAFGAGVLQLSVLMDKGISLALAPADAHTAGFHLLGHAFRYPMELGAAARLNWAQFLYQFPLGIFAIALATALFPSLSADALDHDRTRFRNALRLGVEATLFEGLAASAGLIIVRYPCAKLLFQHGQLKAHDSALIARSVLFYASGIWAYSLLQIVNRAYYALHDTRTPLIMASVNIVINLAVELPLVWYSGLGESGMAVGTTVSFAVQVVVMMIVLQRRIGSLELRRSAGAIVKMVVAALVMWGACALLEHSPIYPHGESRMIWAAQLLLLMGVGAGVYLAACAAMGISVLAHILPRRLLKDPAVQRATR